MSTKQFDKDALESEYNEKCLKYKRLATNLKQAFESFLDDVGVGVLNVTFRIKDFDSFWGKIQRKGYNAPFHQTEDICGLRIVCYYPSDLEKVSQIIKKEFNVLESVDKAALLEPDRFGYRSLHFIVTVRKDWLQAPNYRGLGGLKVEVQVRTVLMHAWADVEHKLAYKKAQHVPDRFRRKLSRLSALFEEADEQLDDLQRGRAEYAKHLISKEAKESGRFDVNQKMNLDSLQAFLDFYFPDKEKTIQVLSELLDEIAECDISFRDLVESVEKTKDKDILPLIEREIFKKWQHLGVSGFTQIGFVRLILDLINDDYWQFRRTHGAALTDQERKKWSAKLRAHII